MLGGARAACIIAGAVAPLETKAAQQRLQLAALPAMEHTFPRKWILCQLFSVKS